MTAPNNRPMDWTHEQIEARLSDYLEGMLNAEERTSFAEHMNSCERCAPLFASVSDLVTNLHSMAELEPAPRLVYAILDQTLGPRENVTGWRGALQWIRGLTSARFIYGAVSVAATFIMIATASGFSWRKPRLADLKPANIYRQADRNAHIAYASTLKFISDLRVVNEIQARFRQEEAVPAESESTLPPNAPQKDRSDGTQPGPRQQNRANGVQRNLELLAQFTAIRAPLSNLPLLFEAPNGRRTR
jgi:anti-sigma factor RsiW